MKNKKKDLSRKVPYIIIGVIVIMFIIGFVIFSNNSLSEEAKEKLKERYNKDFTIIKVDPRGFGALYYRVDVYPNDDPDCVFSAYIDTKDENFSDDYVERYICKQIASQIYDNIDVGDDTFVHVVAEGPQPITSDLNQSIEEYSMLDGKNKFRASIFTTNAVDKLYDWNTLFANLEYLDIYAIVYEVNDYNRVQKIKKYFWRYPNGATDIDFQRSIKDIPYGEVYR